MSIDSMRMGGGRCPPLLVGGLLIACIMMVCNWWTLSSTNLELLRQIDELNEQIKISVEERDQCVTQRGIYEKQLKDCTDDARTTHVKLSQVNENLSTCNEELKSHKQLDVTKTATLETLRIDKQMLEEQNEKLKDEIKQAKSEIEKLKLTINAPPQKQTPILPIIRILEKSKPDNKTSIDGAPPNPQMNAPPNAENLEPLNQDLQDTDNNNAAEVNDAANVVDPGLSMKLISDINVKSVRKTKK
ncbi:uncharacterized protein LOC131674588 isoform X1 [Phymastichus coffea]|uniref:uncharacterized protein LOC131674588 isoform X1 n=1 Tax=Phymastichus coffea TaxID=108790 RepID=UPI00273B3017|nr:uncharacterized protein LOC131674588 isoform X1 [Phymastichus coffea]